MAEQRFRTALNGFHREDVVHYIEYLNINHSAQVNQLNNELDALRKELDALKASLAEADAPCENCAALQSQLDEALSELNDLKSQPSAPAQAPAVVSAHELEAYRRAEQAERTAKERAQQIYIQATATLAQATTQVDDAAGRVQQIADKVNNQMLELQAAVELSKSALLDAATTMYSIRPENME